MAGEKDKPGGGGRLGSLSADTDSPQGRLGNLRMGHNPVASPATAATAAIAAASAGTSGAGAGGAAGGEGGTFTTGGVKKMKFQPKVPTRRKKAQDKSEGGGGSNQLPDQIMQLISQSTADLAVDRRKGRNAGKQFPKPQAPVKEAATRVMFGAGVSKDVGPKSGWGSSGGGGSGSGGSGAPTMSAPSREYTERQRAEQHATNMAQHASALVKLEAKEALLKQEGAAREKREPGLHHAGAHYEEEEEAEAMLDYAKYYPTMLPLRPPEEELHLGLDGPKPEAQGAGEGEGEGDGAAVLGDLVDDVRTAASVIAAAEAAPVGELEDDVGEKWSDKLLLLQLPWCLPYVVPPPAQEEGEGSDGLADGEDPPPPPPVRGALLEEMPAGRLGKLKVYESGAVKLQLGDMLLDVQAGAPCSFSQHAAVINPKVAEGGGEAEKKGVFVFLGDVGGRLIVSPDLDDLDVP